MKEEPPFSVNSLFARHWERFKERNKEILREVEIEEVEKMLSCKKESRGFWSCYCAKCNEYHNVYSGCNSRLCSHYGKRYADKWAENLAINSFDVPHRHIIFTLPPALWLELHKDRNAWKILMDSAMQAVRWLYGNDITPGAVMVLHTFGRDMGFKPHVHGIVTQGGFDNKQKFKQSSVRYLSLNKKWMYIVCNALKAYFPKNIYYKKVFNAVWIKYAKSGFIAKLCSPCLQNKRHIAGYIARYLRHPVIADSRIIFFNENRIVFYYLDLKANKMAAKVMEIDDFMLALLQHIPGRQFKIARYYGAYARRIKHRYLHKSIRQPDLNKLQISAKLTCPKCGFIMKRVIFIRDKPPD